MAKDCYMRKSNITIIKKIISKSKITDLRHWNFCTNCNQDIENFCRREQDQKLILIYWLSSLVVSSSRCGCINSEIKGTTTYLKQSEENEKATKEEAMRNLRFKGSMRFDEGNGIAGMSVFLFEIWVEVQVFTGKNCR